MRLSQNRVKLTLNSCSAGDKVPIPRLLPEVHEPEKKQGMVIRRLQARKSRLGMIRAMRPAKGKAAKPRKAEEKENEASFSRQSSTSILVPRYGNKESIS